MAGRPVFTRLEPLVVSLLLLALLFQAGRAIERVSVTYDEHMYLPAGYTHWALRDFRIARDHPPLTRLVAGLPLQFMDLSMDRSREVFERVPRDQVSWLQYEFGEIFLTEDNLERFDAVVSAARRAMLIFPLILALGVYAWSRELFGPAGALLSLTLVAFNPDVLGHGGLVTTDMPMAAFFLTCIYLFWSHARRPSAFKLATLGIGLGLALATKYSNLLLLPLLLLLTLVALCDPTIRGQPASLLRPFGDGPLARRLAWTGASAGLLAGLAVLVVWATYLFAEAPLAYRRGLDHLYGLANPAYQSFLLGEFRHGRFWSYFLVALGLKLPLATLALFGWSVARGWRRRHGAGLLTVAALVLPPLILLAVMTGATMQIAHRYVFGIYGFVFVACGCLSAELRSLGRGLRWQAAAVAVLLALAVVSGLRAHPFYLSYANALVPSPLAFFDYLSDANNDWQHGWREVARLQRSGELGSVAIHVPPLYARRITPYGIRYASFDLSPGDPVTSDPAPGTYLFSASEYSLARHGPEDAVPLLAVYQPEDVIAGCVLVIRVPARPEAPPPSPLEERELRDDGGVVRHRYRVYRRSDGSEIVHGLYTNFREDGTRAEEGWVSHGEIHGPYELYHPNGVLAEVGATYRGRLHGLVRHWDVDGRLVGAWEYWQGRPLQGG